MAIASDAIHDMGDALTIGLSYLLEKKSKQAPDEHYTYGYLRYSLIGSIITTLILILGSIFVLINAVKRIITPVSINYWSCSTGIMRKSNAQLLIIFGQRTTTSSSSRF